MGGHQYLTTRARSRRVAALCLAVAVTGSLVLAPRAASAAQCSAATFNGFTAGDPTLTINRDAAVVDGALRLTPAANNMAGSAFTTEKVQLGDDRSFSSYFRFRFTGQLSGGADGLVFVVQNIDNTVGTHGGGIGYQGITPSLGVEFDNWHNSEVGDPNDSHVGINLNGSIVSDPVATVRELDDNVIRQAWVDYNGATDRLEVRLADNGQERPAAALLTKENLDLAAVLGGVPDAYVGFTSGTGGSAANHEVLYWQLNNCFDQVGFDDTPRVDAGGPYSGLTDAPIVLSGTASDDGETLSKSWSYVANDGVDPAATCTFEDPASLRTPVTCTHPGSYTLTLTANDGTNPSVTDTAALDVVRARDLMVTTGGPGTGAVTSSPAGIDCGSDCTHVYGDGNVVTLTATPSRGSTFEGWGGDCSGTALSCEVTMSGARNVTARFQEDDGDGPPSGGGGGGGGEPPAPTSPSPTPTPKTPSFSISDASIKEGNSGTTGLRFVIRATEPTPEQVVLHLSSVDGTATAPVDYTEVDRDIVFPAGATEVFVTVNVTGDTEVEPPETLSVTLTTTSAATITDGIGIGSILNDDESGRSITGRVMAHRGYEISDNAHGREPIPDAQVALRKTSDNSVLRSTKTDASGNYMLSNVPSCGTGGPGSFGCKLVVSGPTSSGSGVEPWMRSPNLMLTEVVTVPKRSPVVMVQNFLDLGVLEHMSFVQGEIIEPLAGWPAETDLEVKIYKTDGSLLATSTTICTKVFTICGPFLSPNRQPIPAFTGTTDAFYRFTDLTVPGDKGTRVLTKNDIGKVVLVQEGIEVDSAAAVKSESGTIHIDPLRGVAPPAGGRTITGRVMGHRGYEISDNAHGREPIPSANVSLRKTSDDSLLASTRTDSSGTYTLKNVPVCGNGGPGSFGCKLVVSSGSSGVGVEPWMHKLTTSEIIRVPSRSPVVLVHNFLDLGAMEHGSFVQGEIIEPRPDWPTGTDLEVKIYKTNGDLLATSTTICTKIFTICGPFGSPGNPVPAFSGTSDAFYRFSDLTGPGAKSGQRVLTLDDIGRVVLVQEGVEVDSAGAVKSQNGTIHIAPLHGVAPPTGGRTITGRVMAHRGYEISESAPGRDPIPNATVALRKTSDNSVLKSTKTDASGNYTLRNVPTCGADRRSFTCELVVSTGSSGDLWMRDLTLGEIISVPNRTPAVVVHNFLDLGVLEHRSFVQGDIVEPAGGWPDDTDLEVKILKADGSLLASSTTICAKVFTICGPFLTNREWVPAFTGTHDAAYRFSDLTLPGPKGGKRPLNLDDIGKVVLIQDGFEVDNAPAIKSENGTIHIAPLHGYPFPRLGP